MLLGSCSCPPPGFFYLEFKYSRKLPGSQSQLAELNLSSKNPPQSNLAYPPPHLYQNLEILVKLTCCDQKRTCSRFPGLNLSSLIPPWRNPLTKPICRCPILAVFQFQKKIFIHLCK
ncbi:hypothetical protein CRENBAI_013460 [Crenichthys baileyi]|uniref:Uncharacterized protein n=1 Tax=Crenichthys baileyi TaxID=28760 RepID=A0AAV9SIW9_9TELE